MPGGKKPTTMLDLHCRDENAVIDEWAPKVDGIGNEIIGENLD
jgi:hypothetical protein